MDQRPRPGWRPCVRRWRVEARRPICYVRGTTTTLDVPPEIDLRLDRLAEQTGFAKSLFYPELMRMGIDELEDYFEAAAESERHRLGDGRAHSQAEVRHALGLDD